MINKHSLSGFLAGATVSLLVVTLAGGIPGIEDDRAEDFLVTIQGEKHNVDDIVFHNLVFQPFNNLNTLENVAAQIEPRVEENAHASCEGVDQCVVSLPPGPKDRDRATVKAEKFDYCGGESLPCFRNVLDFSRFTVVVPASGFAEAIENIVATWGHEHTMWLDDRTTYDRDGYRDVQMYVRDEATGLLTEILLLTPEMDDAKHSEGHDLYKEKREIEAQAMEENRDLTAAEQAQVDELDAEMRVIYNTAFERSLD